MRSDSYDKEKQRSQTNNNDCGEDMDEIYLVPFFSFIIFILWFLYTQENKTSR